MTYRSWLGILALCTFFIGSTAYAQQAPAPAPSPASAPSPTPAPAPATSAGQPQQQVVIQSGYQEDVDYTRPRKKKKKPGQGQRIAGWIIGGTGLVFMANAGILYLLAENALTTEEDLARCRPRCTIFQENEAETGDLYRTIAAVELGVGSAALITGLVLLLTAPSADDPPAKESKAKLPPPPPPKPSVNFTVGVGSVGLVGRF